MTVSNTLPQAIALHQQGELQKANALYASILNEDPNHLQTLCLSASIAQDLGDFSKAAKLFTRAHQLNPNQAMICLQLGICYSNLGDLETANSLYIDACSLAPDQIEPIVNLANNLTKLNQFQEAYALYKKALQINPNSAVVNYNIGSLFLKSMKPHEARVWLTKALELQGNYASAWNSLGVALTEVGELKEALHAYQRAIECDPSFEEPIFNSHTVLIDLGDHQAAIAALEKVSALNTENPTYAFFLGMLQEYFGKPEAGSKRLQSLKTDERVKAELESWEYLKPHTQSAILIGSNTKTIELALAQAKLDGLVLEFGVYNGKSIRNIAALVQGKVHGFDSFEGIPENWNDEPSGSYSANGELPEVPSNVTLHKGWFEKTLPGFIAENSGPVRFMNIDCDLYSSTKTIFDLLGPQIVPGTVMCLMNILATSLGKKMNLRPSRRLLPNINGAMRFSVLALRPSRWQSKSFKSPLLGS
jgi:tetratricopeptide (TPR) repeat protein